MVKNLPAPMLETQMGSIPGSGKSPGAQNGNPLQYSCLENSMDKRSLAGKESDMTERPYIYNTYRGIEVTCKIRSPLVTRGQG